MIHLDTNFPIRALVAGTLQDTQLQEWIGSEKLGIDSIVWAEFLCGPLTSQQVAAVQSIVGHIEPFLPQDGSVAAQLFNSSGRRKGSLADCMIAAVCLRVGATLATSNAVDFKHFAIAGLKTLIV